MEDEKLNQQDRQDQKEDNKEKRKQIVKVAVTSSFCTLLLIIIILLLVILGLKKCGPATNISSGPSNTSSQYVEIYDNKTLDNVFKKIVKEQRKIDADEDIIPKDIIAVTYDTSSDNKFNLSITMTTEDNKIFFYDIVNCSYKDNVTGYDNLITYLLSNDEDQDLIFFGEGNITLSYEDINNIEVVAPHKDNARFVISKSPSDIKHISGYYYIDNKYYVYTRLEYTDESNPLGNNEGTLIDDSSLLYGYYLRLSGVIVD